MRDGSNWDGAPLRRIVPKTTTTLEMTKMVMVGTTSLTRISPHAVQRTVGIVGIVITSAMT